ncbi:MAG: hypothetical protein RL154_793 [Pseudomonadota bacterium]|jgi:sulfite reductase (ferredoxin)
MSYYKLPKALEQEFIDFKQTIIDFKSGKVDPLTFKTIRVPFGVYEQRTPDTYMVRIRLACGLVSSVQLDKISDLSIAYADGDLHITTRGDVQLHNVQLDNIEKIIEGLHSVGISSRGGGGNTLRNITADSHPKAPDSVFDVSIHGSVLTTRMLEEKDSFVLPRKFKIAFSSSSADRANATIIDVGFIAKIKDGKRGFSVWTAGGMGAKSKLGLVLYDFVHESEIFIIAEAIKKVFDAHGNRKRKHANRLRFLVADLGFDEYKKLVEEQIAILKANNNSLLNFEDSWFEESAKNPKAPFAEVEEADFVLFLKRFVQVQKNEFFSVKVPLVLGDVNAQKLKETIKELTELGGNIFRCGNDQNLYLYDIPTEWLKTVYKNTKDLSRLTKTPTLVGDIVSCTGAATCQLGIALSRGATSAIEAHLLKGDVDLEILQGFKIHISGCPNSCGKHLIADLGFYGKAGRFEDRLYPAYVVVAGAKIKENETKFAQNIGEVPAYQVPKLVEAILKEIPNEFIGRFDEWAILNEDKLKEIVASFNFIPSFKDDKNPYYDFGANDVFSLKDRGAGECSAGMFDLIESDQKKAKELVAKLKVEDSSAIKDELALVTARMLLVARGEEARDAKSVFATFKAQFINTNLISADFTKVTDTYLNGGSVDSSSVIALADAVIALYAKMDHSLKFTAEIKLHADDKLKVAEVVSSEIEVFDYKGVACPMNFVKTKMALSKKKSGETIDVLLDSGAPIENVPNSVKAEGHKIESMTQEGEHWRVRIVKK